MNERAPAKKLGTLLMQRGLLTPEQLEEALADQRLTRKFLGAILVEQGAVEPLKLLEVLSEQFGIPHGSIAPSEVDWNVAKQFPPSFFSDEKCFPIRADETTVTVAIADPLDAWSLSSIQGLARFKKIQPMLVLDRELKAICRTYRAQTLKALQQRLGSDGVDRRH